LGINNVEDLKNSVLFTNFTFMS